MAISPTPNTGTILLTLRFGNTPSQRANQATPAAIQGAVANHGALVFSVPAPAAPRPATPIPNTATTPPSR